MVEGPVLFLKGSSDKCYREKNSRLVDKGGLPFHVYFFVVVFFSPLLPALPSSYLSAGFAGSSYLLPISGVLRYLATLLPKSFTSGVRGGDTVVNWILVFTGPHTHASRTHTQPCTQRWRAQRH